MSPKTVHTTVGYGRVPRASGDEPEAITREIVEPMCSPRERG